MNIPEEDYLNLRLELMRLKGFIRSAWLLEQKPIKMDWFEALDEQLGDIIRACKTMSKT